MPKPVHLLVLVFIVGLFVSCRKEKAQPANPCRLTWYWGFNHYFEGTQLIAQAKGPDSSRYFYRKGRVVRKKHYHEQLSEPATYTDYFYDKKGNLVSDSTYYNTSGKKMLFAYTVYFNDLSGKRIEEKQYTVDTHDYLSERGTYSYHAGNLIEQHYWKYINGHEEWHIITNYTHDDKKNPVRELGHPGIFYPIAETGLNNITSYKVSEKYFQNPHPTEREYSYVYEYNENGYPTKGYSNPYLYTCD